MNSNLEKSREKNQSKFAREFHFKPRYYTLQIRCVLYNDKLVHNFTQLYTTDIMDILYLCTILTVEYISTPCPIVMELNIFFTLLGVFNSCL